MDGQDSKDSKALPPIRRRDQDKELVAVLAVKPYGEKMQMHAM